MKWFRFYTEVLHDPKVQRLPAALFKSWVNLLCIANKDRDRGMLPSVEDIAFALRVKPCEAEKILYQLKERGLLDRAQDGTLSPHNWTERQRNSDDGATRQQRYREKNKRENSELAPKVTSPSRHGDAPEVEIDKIEKRTEKETSPEALRLSDLLAELILANNPANRELVKGKREITVARWAGDIDKLLRMDGQKPETVERVIRWCQADIFWKANILSGAKLRQKWDTLVVRMETPSTTATSGAGNAPTFDDPLTKLMCRER